MNNLIVPHNQEENYGSIREDGVSYPKSHSLARTANVSQGFRINADICLNISEFSSKTSADLRQTAKVTRRFRKFSEA